MKKETTLWLLLLIAALGAVVWWQRGREEQDLGAIDVPLYEGVEIGRVKAFDVDHIERSYQLRLERDARGAWYMTDPMLYPADLALVRLLLEVVATGRALVVPEIEQDSQALGFEPPRALFTVEEEVGGTTLRHVLEIGQLDLDGRRVNVRKDGRYLRTLRNLDTTLRRSVFDFRSRQAMQIDGADVVELNRTGRYQRSIEDVPVDLRLNALRDGAVWRALYPHQVALDPLDVAVVSHGTSSLQVDSFVDDAPVSLAEYGLEEPEFRIELATSEGGREALRFGRTGFGGSWYACREGEPFVFGVAQEDLMRLILPFEDLLDRHMLRVAREQVDALRLECEGRTLLVARTEAGWTVSELGLDSAPAGAVHPAEAARVEEILSRLEHAEVVEFRLEEPFPQDAARAAIYVEAAGQTLGGRIGPALLGAEGRELVLFQRTRDDVAALAEPWLAELACTGLDELRSLALVRVDEVDLIGLELARGAEVLRYARSDRGRWSRAGEQSEATELVAVLDPLIFLRAREHVAAGPEALADPIAVALGRRDGSALSFTVGRLRSDTGARSAVELSGSRSLLQVADLHDRLLALFAE